MRSIGDVKDEICVQDGVYGVLRRIGVRNVKTLTCAIKDTSLPVTSKCARFYSTEFTDRSADANKKNYIRSEKFMYITGMESDLTQEHCYFNGSEANYRYVYFMIALDRLNFETQTQANLTTAANEWLAENPISVQYELAKPVFEPFADQTPFYEVNSHDGATYISFAGESENVNPVATIRFPRHEDGALVTETYCDGKKAKFEPFVMTETITLNPITVNAGASISIGYDCGILDGYECVGVVGYNSGIESVAITAVSMSGITLRNLNTESPYVVTPTITVLRVKKL